jgi:hypothetical protein
MDNDLSEKLAWKLVTAALVILAIMTIMLGCASMEPSSTDPHHRVPEVNCGLIKYQGHVHKYCCDGDECEFED